MMGCLEGFNVIHLNADGTFAVAYETFGWKAA